jgi:integrase
VVEKSFSPLDVSVHDGLYCLVDALGVFVRLFEQLALALSAYAGLRCGEVRGLRWGDVDLQAGEIVVRRAIRKGLTA